MYRLKAVPASLKFVDNSWQRSRGRRAIAAGIVKEDNISSSLSYIFDDVPYDLVRQWPHPIVRVDGHTHRHVTQGSRNRERVRLL